MLFCVSKFCSLLFLSSGLCEYNGFILKNYPVEGPVGQPWVEPLEHPSASL